METGPGKKEPSRLPRSSELMSRDDTALLVVDVQEKLVPHIRDHQRIVWNIRRLVDAARLLDIPVGATEQYPRGLGATVPPLVDRLGEIPSKLAFSCAECGDLFRGWADAGRDKILVTGVEAHVCVMQTVMDLLHEGFRVYLATDAVGSRHEWDYQVALRRSESAGAVLTTTEAALFEWCEVAGTPEFKQISLLVREEPPRA